MLGFKILGVEEKYYADGEDAYDMKLHFKNLKINKKADTEEEDSKKEAQAMKESFNKEEKVKLL